MGKLNEIRDKLLAGSTTSQLVDQGYAKSSVFNVAKKLKNTKPVLPNMPVSDELQELRQKRDMIKLQKEIAELEAAKEKLPERVTALENTVPELRSFLLNAVDTVLFISLQEAGWSSEEAKEYADGWVEKNIKG
jgi:polyhydroxyalkanoate synthesis regulator phasin